MSSPSAVSKVKGCARQFALNLFTEYVQGKEAALGDEVHEQADDYQKFGKAPDLTTTAGLMLEPGLPYMPHPRTGNAEGKVRWTFRGLAHNFRMDLNGFVRDLPQALGGADPNMPYVLDYKTQKDKGGREKDQQLWGKAAFLADEEAVLYALRRMSEVGSRECYLRWLYLRGPNAEGKLRPKARPSDAIVTVDECLDAYKRMYEPAAKVVDKIYELRDKKYLTVVSAMHLPPNPHQCTKYGIKYACPHIDKCKLSPEFIAVETSKEDTYMTQLQGNDLFAAMQAAMGAPAPTPAAQPQPVVNPNAFGTIPGVPIQQVPPQLPPQLTTPANVAPVYQLPVTNSLPTAPAFVNPPEAPHVPAPAYQEPVIMPAVGSPLRAEPKNVVDMPAPELAMDTDEALGFAVRVLVTFAVRTYKGV